MKSHAFLLAIILAPAFAWHAELGTQAQADVLPAPGFHHLHLNTTNPEAAIDFYARQFPSTSKTTFAGAPALSSPNNVLVLFTKVAKTPPNQGSAIWHFGWHVVDVRKTMDMYKQRADVKLLPLYTTDEGGSVFVSSDTWPGTTGVLGLTKPQIAEARAKDVKPAGGAGFAYLQGPDEAIVEYQGNMPAERFNHVHMYWVDPFCAQLWYRTHLNAPAGGVRGSEYTQANCKVPRATNPTWPALEKAGMYRAPSAGVTFGDVLINSYIKQDDRPFPSTRGYLADHFALSVGNLDAWAAKLRGEGVRFLEQPYKLGDTRAFMVEGPSREAIELVEVR